MLTNGRNESGKINLRLYNTNQVLTRKIRLIKYESEN